MSFPRLVHHGRGEDGRRESSFPLPITCPPLEGSGIQNKKISSFATFRKVAQNFRLSSPKGRQRRSLFHEKIDDKRPHDRTVSGRNFSKMAVHFYLALPVEAEPEFKSKLNPRTLSAKICGIGNLEKDQLMSFIYIDESGQFKKSNDGEFFVVASFTVGDSKRTEKRFKSWLKEKFPKKMRSQPEIKFSDATIKDELRIKTIKFIANLDVIIRYSFLKRANIPEGYIRKEKIKSGELYTHIVGDVLEKYLPITDHEFRAFCDQRHVKGITKAKFKSILEAQIRPKLPKNTIIQIEMVDSTSSANIQIADWITGALAHYLEGKKNGKLYFDILKNNIIAEGNELFKDHRQNKKPNRSD